MTKVLKLTGILLSLLLILALTAFFVMKGPQPDIHSEAIDEASLISLAGIQTENSQFGMFKSAVTVHTSPATNDYLQFFGQKIAFVESEEIDSILIGITHNHISRIEVWKSGKVIKSKELGFMNKMTWGEEQQMEVEFYDQSNSRYTGESKIIMRFFTGLGITGSIGEVRLNLSGFGDLTGDKEISTFVRTSRAGGETQPRFSDLKVWKNFNSYD